MERQLQARILSWRVGRAVRTGRGLAGGCVAMLLVIEAFRLHSLPPGNTTFASPCIPYTLRLPRAWRVEPVPMPDCGAPVLFDEYHLTVQGQQLSLSIQAVSLVDGRFMNLIGLPQSAGSVTRHGGGGQVYASLLQRQNGVTIADGAFNRPPLSYLMTVESDGAVDPEPVLIQAMDGWGDRAAGN